MNRTNIIIIISSIATLLFVLELVRRRKLREEYSWLWLLTAIVYLIVTLWSSLGDLVTEFIGTNSVPIAFAFLGLQFLVIMSIQFSVRLSNLTTQIKDISQEIAILDNEIRNLKQESAIEIKADTVDLLKRNEILAQKVSVLEIKLGKLNRISREQS